MIRLGNRVRAGFTLVEMLVVIVIISILAALITAAAASALWAAKQTKIKVEVDMLAGAMENFKQKYGSYPPANLSMFIDTNGAPYANAQLTAFVAKAFPRYATPTASSLSYQIGADLTGYGLPAPGGSVQLQHPTVANPQVALVFWLSGFTSDPTDPFNRYAQASYTRTPLFTFDQTRLLSTSGGAASPGVTAWFGQMVYNAPYGNAAYCYFDSQSYGQLMYTNQSNQIVVGSAAPLVSPSSSPGYGGIAYASTAAPSTSTVEWLSSSYGTNFQLANGTGYVMPYVLDVGNVGTWSPTDTFCKPTSFQIISAGQDGSFGTITQPGYGRLYPTAFNYDLPPPNGGSGDDDNVTNFCEKNSLESAKP